MKKYLFVAALFSCSALAGIASAQSRDAASSNLVPRCTQNIGNVVIVDSQQEMFAGMEMSSPADLLRYLVRESGCFTLIQRVPGATPVAGGRVAEFAIAANLTNEIELGDGRTGVLGVVGRNRATRWVADKALESSTGGMVSMDRLQTGMDMAHDGRLDAAVEAAVEAGVMVTGAAVQGAGYLVEQTAETADSYNRAYAASGNSSPADNAQMAAATTGARVAGRGLGALGRAMQQQPTAEEREELDRAAARFGVQRPSLGDAFNQPGARLLGLGPRKSEAELTREAMEELKKDLGRGKVDAQIEMSVISLPLAEVVAEAGDKAGKDDVRRLRIPNNPFGGRVGRGWESSDEGKAITLAITNAYTQLVTDLGGMGSTTPDVTIATREAIRRAEEAKQAAEQPRRTAARPTANRQARRAQPAQAEVLRTAILRDAPAGRVVTQLSAGSTVYPTGEVEDGWREVEDEDGNTGWLQNDRIVDLD